MKTIREMIREKSAVLREIDKLGPHKAAEEMVELCSLLSSLNAEIVEKQFLMNKKKVEMLEYAGSVAKANVLVQASEAWNDWYERVKQAEALQDLIRSIKYYIRTANDERREFTR